MEATCNKQMEHLRQKRRNVEMAAGKASEQMRQHYRSVTSKLSEVLTKQYNVIDNLKRKQMREIDDEERRIDGIIQRMEKRKADIHNLLHQDVSPMFIQQCKKDMAWAVSNQDEWKRSALLTWKQTVFVPPEAPPIHSREYLGHCERSILVYFINTDIGEKMTSEFTESKRGEITRYPYSSDFSGAANMQSSYHKPDSMSLSSTLIYNDNDEYATQYSASDRAGSVTSQMGMYSTTYNNIKKHEGTEDKTPIYEQITPHSSLAFPPNVPHNFQQCLLKMRLHHGDFKNCPQN